MTENGELAWLKISLVQIYCVQQVVSRQNADQVWQTWTCTEKDCTGTGNYVGNFYMTISTEGATLDRPPISDCSFGDTVTYGRRVDTSLGTREIVIIGKATTEVQGKISCC